MEIYSELPKAMVILSKNFLHLLFPSSFLSLALMHISKYTLKPIDDSTIQSQKRTKIISGSRLELESKMLLKNFPFLNIYFLLGESWYSLVSCRSTEKLILIAQSRKFTGLDLQVVSTSPFPKLLKRWRCFQNAFVPAECETNLMFTFHP